MPDEPETLTPIMAGLVGEKFEGVLSKDVGWLFGLWIVSYTLMV